MFIYFNESNLPYFSIWIKCVVVCIDFKSFSLFGHSGEADCLIAKHLKEDERAYCVFSGDTDFCIFPNSKYVNHELFDLRNDLGLGRNTLTVQTPEKLMCGVISSTRLAQFLKVSCIYLLMKYVLF